MKRLTGADVLELEDRLRAVRQRVLGDLGRFADGRRHTELAGELLEIDAALQRIDYGVIGICVLCGACISPEHLRRHPTARLCAGCTGRPVSSSAA